MSQNKGVNITPQLVFFVPLLYWKLLYRKFSLHFFLYLSFNSCYLNPLHWNCCLWNLHQWSLMRVESIKNFTNKSGHFIAKYTLVFNLLLCDFSCCINATLALKKNLSLLCISFYLFYLLCDTISEKMWTNVYSLQVRNQWQRTEATLAKPKPGSQRFLWVTYRNMDDSRHQ